MPEQDDNYEPATLAVRALGENQMRSGRANRLPKLRKLNSRETQQ
jgi:hypothetical protein